MLRFRSDYASRWSRQLPVPCLDVHKARLDDLATPDDPHWNCAEPEPWFGEPGLPLAALPERFAALRTATLALLINAIDHNEQHLATLA